MIWWFLPAQTTIACNIHEIIINVINFNIRPYLVYSVSPTEDTNNDWLVWLQVWKNMVYIEILIIGSQYKDSVGELLI